jgi:hypothetical protein
MPCGVYELLYGTVGGRVPQWQRRATTFFENLRLLTAGGRRPARERGPCCGMRCDLLVVRIFKCIKVIRQGS